MLLYKPELVSFLRAQRLPDTVEDLVLAGFRTVPGQERETGNREACLRHRARTGRAAEKEAFTFGYHNAARRQERAYACACVYCPGGCVHSARRAMRLGIGVYVPASRTHALSRTFPVQRQYLRSNGTVYSAYTMDT